MRLALISIQAGFIACRTLGVDNWSWEWVMAPTIIVLALFSVVGMFAVREANKYRAIKRLEQEE